MKAKSDGDISELKYSLSLYQDLVETSQDLIWQCDAEGRYTFLNPAWETIFGYTVKEMMGRKFSDFQTPETAARDAEQFRKLMQGGIVKGYETVHIGKDGNEIHLVFNAKYFRSESGEVLGTRGTAYDITERRRYEKAMQRKDDELSAAMSEMEATNEELIATNDELIRTETSLKESHERLLIVLESIDALVYICDMETYEVLFINKYGREEWGDIVGKKCWQSLQKGLDGPCSFCTNYRLRTADGTPTGVYEWEFQNTVNKKWYECRDKAVLWTDHRYVRMEIATDITARKQAEEKLLFISKAIEATSEAIGISDNTGRHIYQNKALSNLFGYTTAEELQAAGGGPAVVKDPEVAEEMFKNIMSGHSWSGELEMVTKSGRVFPAYEYADSIKDSNGDIAGLIGIITDISERKQAEDERLKYEKQILHNQKLESLGILAGGIAHDFNNLMGGIFGYLDLASGCSRDQIVRDHLEKALSTINRARGLTGQLLTFAKGGAPIQKVTQLKSFIHDTIQFALSGSNVLCRFDIYPDLWPCSIDQNQIGQVIENIVINAAQAMPMGGTIDLTARNIEISGRENISLPKGNYVRISIRDYGTGIPADILSRIFDPFFTTKTSGHGLGLATCHSIIVRHGGLIDVESETGKGSTFHITLPASSEIQPDESETVDTANRGKGRILIMDDEEIMRDTISQMLLVLGYSTVCKNDGREAIDCFVKEKNAGNQMAAMIFDLTVPGGLGGKDAIKEIRKVDSEIPVFVVSGYAEDPIMKNPADYGFTSSLSKPFTQIELSRMLAGYLSKNIN